MGRRSCSGIRPPKMKRRKKRKLAVQSLLDIASSILLQKPQAEEGSTTRFMPPDVVACILLMLPVKSLARFRCVCKQWRSWTCEHDFIDEHHRLGLSRSLVIMHRTPKRRLVAALYGVGANCDEPKRSPLRMRLNGDVSFPANVYGDLSNSVNGLVAAFCISRSMLDPPGSVLQPYLINLVTRDHLQVPGGRVHRDGCWIELGLGFDASRGVYKLVTFQASRDGSSYSSCKVLTVGVGEWRDLGRHALCVVSSSPVSADGAVYWMAYAVDRPRSILAFDVKKEKFRFIPMPKTRFGIALDPMMNLLSLDGRVCFAESTVRSKPAIARVWKLEGKPGHEHWRLEYEIDTSDWLEKTRSHANAIPWVADIRGGRAILRTSQSIGSYDLRNNTLHHLLNCVETLIPSSAVIAESLISPSNLIEG